MARDRERRLLPRRGSVPLALHGLLEYGVGFLLIMSSSLLYDEDTARAVSILVGAAVLAIAALSDMPTALLRRIPINAHVFLDFTIGVLLVASPFIFGFDDDEAALASFVLIGIGYLFLTALTRFQRRE